MTSAMDTDTDGLEPDGELLWSIRTVTRKTGLSPASIYRYMARNMFPAQRRIGPGRVAWLASEILAWVESRPRLGQYHPEAGPLRNSPTDRSR
jgi:prophage regulatory protein